MTCLLDKSGGFRLTTPIEFFSKAGASGTADADEERYFGGLITTETRDYDGDEVLARGLNFDPFLNGGWFNDNHSETTGDGVGKPTAVTFVRKGTKLPSGKTAPSDGFWAEGRLLVGHPPADKIWTMAKAAEKLGAHIGFSIQGKVRARDAVDRHKVVKADVFEVAITRCPKNTDTHMTILAKALRLGENLVKSFNGAPGVTTAVAPEVPAGLDAGQQPERENADASVDALEAQLLGLFAKLDGVVDSIGTNPSLTRLVGGVANPAEIAKAVDPDVVDVDPAEDVSKASSVAPVRAPVGGTPGDMSPLAPSGFRPGRDHADEAVALVKARLPDISDLSAARVVAFAAVRAGVTKMSDLTNNHIDAALKEMSEQLSKGRTGRQEELIKKAQANTASPAERAELAQLLNPQATLAPQVSQNFGGEDLSKAQKVDASGFLKSVVEALEKSQRQLAENLEKSIRDREQGETVMLKGLISTTQAVVQLSELVKGMQTAFDKFMDGPARGPKSDLSALGPTQVAGQATQTPVAAPAGGELRLEKGKVLELLSRMNKDPEVSERGLSKTTGLSFTDAWSDFQQPSSTMDPRMRDEVLRYAKKNGV